MPKKRRVNARPSDFEEAAVTILKGSRRPLSVREITDEMIRLGIVEASGKTPQNSMQNTIRRANERRKAMKEPPLFVRQKSGGGGRFVYSLKD